MHSGADLQSAAASVLGYDQVSMKGKAIRVPPVPGVATAQLKTLLEAILPKAGDVAAVERHEGVGGVTQALQEVERLMAVRRALLPALVRGSQGCGERLRHGPCNALLHQGASSVVVRATTTIAHLLAAPGLHSEQQPEQPVRVVATAPSFCL